MFFYPHTLYVYIFLRKSWIRIVALSSAHFVPKECNFIAPPSVILQFLIAQFFSLLTPTMLNVEYIYITYIANCNRINSVWVQCDNTAAKLFIGLLYKCNKFQKNCPKNYLEMLLYIFRDKKIILPVHLNSWVGKAWIGRSCKWLG